MTGLKRVLVTGAAGFVGANLTRRLEADGHLVTTLERPNGDRRRLEGVAVTRREVELRDASAVMRLVRDVKPEWIFHLAASGAYSWQTNRRDIFETNVFGTFNLLAASLKSDCEVFVNTGSSSEYGFVGHAPSEVEAPRPNSDYAVAKSAATLHTGFAGRKSGRRFVTLRLYSAYGPWEDERRLVPTLIAHGLRGELPPLVGPMVARDFVFVDDVVDAYLRVPAASEVEAGGIYNIGTGAQTTISQVVELTRQYFAIEQEPCWETMPDRDWDTSVWVADPRRASAELGWRARTDLASGFRATVEWTRRVCA